MQTYGNDNGARRTSPVITWRKSGVKVVLAYLGPVTTPFGAISVIEERALDRANNSKRAKETL